MMRYFTRTLLLLLLSSSLTTSLLAQELEFSFTYTMLPRGNQTPVLPDGDILFPDTLVNLQNSSLSQTNTATFVVVNRASRTVILNNISTFNDAFKLGGLPLLPVVLQPGQSLSLSINFQPVLLGPVASALRLEFTGRTVNFNLKGNGIASILAYDFIVGATERTVTPTDTLVMPQTNLGDKTTATMRIRNTGNADAVINFLASSDPLFVVSNGPFLPFTLPAGGSVSFNLTFTPVQPGTFTARLKVGDVTFNVSGVGAGVSLAFTANVGSASANLAANGTVIFTPTQVGSTSTAQIQISNTGNAAAFINSISVAGPATGVFTLQGVPGLPLRVDGGATSSFNIAFAPIALGQAAGTLKIDNQTFNITGVGNAPPPLPAVTFSGATAAVDAAQQMGVGVTLSNPYPVQLNGKLTLGFTSTADVFGDDPAIAFASGGRTVNFIVPANSRNAVFGVSDSQIRFQTGTVAGTITLTATFATDAGGINLTSTSAPATNISVRPSAPRISAVQIASRTASSFTVVITGYSPTRSVNAMEFRFNPFVDPNNKDLKLETTSFSVQASGPFGVWYQSAPSQAFGSLFTAAVTFNVSGSVDAIQSLNVTISNSVGTSNTGTVTLR